MTDATPSQKALFALAYDELKRLARGARRGRNAMSATLDTTALVHEAFLKVGAHADAIGMDVAHLRALVARAMRQILVDRARRRMTRKHGSGPRHVTLDGVSDGCGPAPYDLVLVDRVLDELEGLDARLARVVELHVFGGMSMAEVATALAVAERTAFRDWRRARAFLIERLDLATQD